MTQSFYWKSKRVGSSNHLDHTDTSIEVITPDVAFNRYLVQLYKKLCSDKIIGKLMFSSNMLDTNTTSHPLLKQMKISC